METNQAKLNPLEGLTGTAKAQAQQQFGQPQQYAQAPQQPVQPQQNDVQQ